MTSNGFVLFFNSIMLAFEIQTLLEFNSLEKGIKMYGKGSSLLTKSVVDWAENKYLETIFTIKER